MAKLPSKEEQKAIRERIWAAFSVSLPGGYTTTPNEILQARITNEALPLELRFDALIERKSLGNWSLFACERDWRTGKAVALNQGDCAKILRVDKRRISEIVVIRQAQGFVQPKEGLDNPSLLMLVLDPQAPAAIPEKEVKPRVTWSTFSKHWDETHPVEIERRAQLLAQAAPFLDEAKEIYLQKLAAFKKAKEEVQAEGPDVSDQESATSRTPESATSRTAVRNVPDALSDTSGLILPPESHGHDIAPRVRGLRTLNSLSESDPLSVGRSLSSEEVATDRPTTNQELETHPFKAELRDWLESHIKLPVALEDPELNQIAKTIKTSGHFKQFQEAALRQKHPRGWKVYVKIALDCKKHQAKYEKATSTAVRDLEDPLLKRMREDAERRKTWNTD